MMVDSRQGAGRRMGMTHGGGVVAGVIGMSISAVVCPGPGVKVGW